MQLGSAVAFAHTQRIIHRDIKPSNIMIGNYDETILLDWGLAIGLDNLTQQEESSSQENRPGTITGTPQYMAPEAIHGDISQISTPVDVYGLGSVLYEILTLTPAYKDLGFLNTIMQVRTQDLEPPTSRAPQRDIPSALEKICLQSMSSSPENRPSAAEFTETLKHILNDQVQSEHTIELTYPAIESNSSVMNKLTSIQDKINTTKLGIIKLNSNLSEQSRPQLWQLEDHLALLQQQKNRIIVEVECTKSPDILLPLYKLLHEQALAEYNYPEAKRWQQLWKQIGTQFNNDKYHVPTGTIILTALEKSFILKIYRYEEELRHLNPKQESIEAHYSQPIELLPGSYLLEYTLQNHRSVNVPVRVSANEQTQIHLCRPPPDLGQNYIFIPAGTTTLGGDEQALGSTNTIELHLKDYAMSRTPITCDEYLTFINELHQQEPTKAQQHLPRSVVSKQSLWNFSETENKFYYPEIAPTGQKWDGEYPITYISYTDASAYAQWLSKLSNKLFRLPYESEWEKAARGVDGRYFPWGNHFEPSFCKTRFSQKHPSIGPAPVASFPIDQSPYKVVDMAGNVREICQVHAEQPSLVSKGGSWADEHRACRAASRQIISKDYVSNETGFRLVIDLDEPETLDISAIS